MYLNEEFSLFIPSRYTQVQKVIKNQRLKFFATSLILLSFFDLCITRWVKARRVSSGRDIGIYPETKHPTFHRALGLGIEDRLIASLNAAGWNSRSAPVLVQSFEPGSLKEMKVKGLPPAWSS